MKFHSKVENGHVSVTFKQRKSACVKYTNLIFVKISRILADLISLFPTSKPPNIPINSMNDNSSSDLRNLAMCYAKEGVSRLTHVKTRVIAF